MALNRFSASILKRSEGKNSLARAAYNGRCELKDERTGKEWDFRKKSGLEFEGTFAPENAPSWAKKRQDLWAHVEAKEDQQKRRDDAQLARDFKISLPHELNKKQREELISDFVRKELVSQGMVADVCIHHPEENNDERNFHAHILTTLRSINRDGFGKKNRDWNEKKFLENLREKWSEYGAKALHHAGYKLEAERFSYGHLTLDEQRKEAIRHGDKENAENLDRDPMRPVGPNGKAMEQDGIKTTRSQHNDETKERNEQRQWDRETKRDDKKRGRVAERIHNAYEESLTAADFKARLEKDNLFVARVTKQDIELYGPDYSDPREELERYKWLEKKGAWLMGKEGVAGLNPEQRMRAREAWERYKEDLIEKSRKNTFSFEGYVKHVQMETDRRVNHLTEYAKVLDFADGGQVKRSDFFAKHGEYVVLTKGGHVYRLNQATTGDMPSEVKEFMKSLDGRPIRSVTDTREYLEAMRVADRQERAAGRMENATRGHRQNPYRVAGRALDKTFEKTESGLRFATDTVSKTFNALTKAMDSVADMFTNFFPTQREQERQVREQEFQKDQQRGFGRER